MNNEIRINVPEGMEIDKENSTFECIKFKPKWIPKRGDIAAAGDDHCQIILVGEYIKPSGIIGFNIKCLAIMDKRGALTLGKDLCNLDLWVLEEASTSEKELFIEKLNEQGYIYDPNDPRVIYKKEKELPKTWSEFCRINPIKDGEFFINNYSDIKEMNKGYRDCVIDANLLPSKEYAEAMLALCKLIQLRDCYNDGWKPDWNSLDIKYTLCYYCNKIVMSNLINSHALLAFKTERLRDAFYENFRDLIEQAKLLL
jgi:hypothetical protein